jgi:hypothetical protein
MSCGGIFEIFGSGRFDQYVSKNVHPFGMSPLNVAVHPSHAHSEPAVLISANGIVFISNTFALRRWCLFMATPPSYDFGV